MKKKYSDLELLRLLEANGYAATAENCMLLKEGLATGRYLIEEDEPEAPEADEKEEKAEDKAPEKEDDAKEEKADDKDADDSDEKKDDEKKDDAEVVEEAVSDYALYKLLESSGYKTTRKNLKVLKEGIGSGKFVISECDGGKKAAPKAKKAPSTKAPKIVKK